MKRLIVTADDFGAAIEVNEAVETAHRKGMLTAASLMVAAPAVDDALARARRTPSLRIGLHLVLVEGRPALPPSELPDLVDATGRFRTDMARMGVGIFLKPHVRLQLAREIEAQFQAFAATGLALDHVNTHKHYLLHPTVTGLVLRIGRRFGLRAARAPIEPRRTLAVVEPGAKLSPDHVTDPWSRLVRMRMRAAGVLLPDQVFGLAWSGAMTPERLAGILEHLPPGLSEIYLHPALSGGFDGAAPGYRYADELAALLDPRVVAAARRPEVRLGGFSDFLPAERPRAALHRPAELSA